MIRVSDANPDTIDELFSLLGESEDQFNLFTISEDESIKLRGSTSAIELDYIQITVYTCQQA